MLAALHVWSAVLLTVVVCVAAGTKIRSAQAFQSFSTGLTPFGWLPAPLRRTTAVVVVLAEVFTGLLAWVAPRFGAALSLVLLLVFTTATLQAGRASNCHCFGDSEGTEVGGTALFVSRNVVLATATVLLALPVAGLPALPISFAAGSGGLLIAALAIRADDIAYLFARGSIPVR